MAALTALRDMLMFEAGTLARAELESRISQADDQYLTAFLLKAGMKSAKVPKGSKPMKDRCVKWVAEEIAERRPFVLLTAQELKEKYREIKGANPKSKWNADDLTTEILRPASANTNPRRSNNVIDPDSLEQELMNIVVRGMALKKLEG